MVFLVLIRVQYRPQELFGNSIEWLLKYFGMIREDNLKNWGIWDHQIEKTNRVCYTYIKPSPSEISLLILEIF